MAKKVKGVTVPATTNNITSGIINFLLFEGHTASRINTMGIYDTTIGDYRPSGSRRGFSDIAAGIKGKYYDCKSFCQFVVIEIKKGRDEMREDQEIFKAEVEAAGGTYLEMKTLIQFYDWYHKQDWIIKKEQI